MLGPEGHACHPVLAPAAAQDVVLSDRLPSNGNGLCRCRTYGTEDRYGFPDYVAGSHSGNNETGGNHRRLERQADPGANARHEDQHRCDDVQRE